MEHSTKISFKDNPIFRHGASLIVWEVNAYHRSAVLASSHSTAFMGGLSVIKSTIVCSTKLEVKCFDKSYRVPCPVIRVSGNVRLEDDLRLDCLTRVISKSRFSRLPISLGRKNINN